MKKTLLFLSVIGLLITSCEKGIFSNKIVDSDGNEYKTVTNPTTGKTWLDRNLGASQIATSSTDTAAYGDLYQWGRGADGHQSKNSDTISSLSSTNDPGHSAFITSNSGNFDWRSPQNNNLWQGVNGDNNPCPDGYRLPTKEEWEEEKATWVSDDAAGAFASPLKLPMAGSRWKSNGLPELIGIYGYYWSSTFDRETSYYLYFSNSRGSGIDDDDRAHANCVRCIKD